MGGGDNVFGQKENYVWYFGDNAGIDFNSGIPVALPYNPMIQLEGCATISDGNGNLLFYTNGLNAWNRNLIQMPNGDSLGGEFSSTQSTLIVQKPGSNLLYYVFTVGGQFSSNLNFSYSIIDMSLNSGNGDVTIKNNLIDTLVSEKLTGVKCSNDSDVWIMVHGVNNNNFYCYKLTSGGLIAPPVVTSIGPVIPNLSINKDLIGYMKFSADGTKIAYAANETSYIDLFDFNSATGVVTNEKYLTLPPP